MLIDGAGFDREAVWVRRTALERRLRDGVVVLPLHDRRPRALRGAAAIVWEALDRPASGAELEARVTGLVGATPRAEHLREALDVLVREHLVEPDGG